MFGQLGIETAKFTRERARLEGDLSLAQLPRLAQQLFDLVGSIGYSVDGYVTDRGDPALAVRIAGSVNLRCQRCLGRLPLAVKLRRDFVLIRGADEFEPRSEEDDLVDVIPAAPRLDLQALLEEEVLLGLPMAPRHAEGECRAPGAAVTDGQGREASTFAALASLKR